MLLLNIRNSCGKSRLYIFARVRGFDRYENSNGIIRSDVILNINLLSRPNMSIALLTIVGENEDERFHICRSLF